MNNTLSASTNTNFSAKQSSTRKKGNIPPRLYPLLASLLAAVIFLLLMASFKVLGKGNNTILQGDLEMQYMSFLQMFKRWIKGESSFWYTFSSYFGSGAILTYAYYTLCPLNLLMLIEGIDPSTIILIIITLKIALAAGTMEFFLQKVIKREAKVTILFSQCYALCAFVTTLYFNLIWLDAVYMLPIITYLIMKYVKTGKFLSIVPAFAYLFITNFYMGFMVGVFAAMVFLLYIFYCETFDEKKRWIRRVLRKSFKLLFAVILGAAICAAVLLPCFFFLYSHTAPDNFDFDQLTAYLPEILNAMFIGQSGSLNNTLPFLYCGLPVLLLVPFYFLNKKRSLKEKLFIGGLLIFYLISMCFLPIYKFMHAFDYPNYYAFRYSFIISFILVAIAAKEFVENGSYNLKHLMWYIAGLAILYSALIPFKYMDRAYDERTNTQTLFVINLLYLFIWGLFIANKHRMKAKRIASIFATVLLVSELWLNGYNCPNGGLVFWSEDDYTTWQTEEGNAIASIKEKDSSFYRIKTTNEHVYNAGCFFDYPSITTFSSSDDYNLRMLLWKLGYGAANRALLSTGATPVTDMLFATKYTVHFPDSADVMYVVGEEEKDETANPYSIQETSIECNPCALPLGYMVSGLIKDFTTENSDNPFENQLFLLYCMTGKEYRLFDYINQPNISAENVSYNKAFEWNTLSTISSSIEGGIYAIFSPHNDSKSLYAVFTVDAPSFDSYSPVFLSKNMGIDKPPYMSLGNIQLGFTRLNELTGEYNDIIEVIFSEGIKHARFNNLYIASYEKGIEKAAYEDLAENIWNITSFSEDRIEGTVISSEERPVLFTSIPYDECWKATVDGMPANVYPIVEDAFCGLVLPAGEHTVILTYEPKGAAKGAIMSICSIGLYLLMIAYDRIKKIRK
ncbi:MAG: YfhO family protein [Lachnospiraceae bacterium]|nr:YfhO family protein [Lachnospiraceae bacterium]